MHMGQEVSYIVKSKPRTIKNVSMLIGGIGILILVFVDFLYTPFKSLPLELQVFALGELIPRIFYELNAASVILFITGIILYSFRWRNGTIILTDNQIKIDGQIGVLILVDTITEVRFYDSDYRWGNKRMALVKTIDNLFKLKFKSDDTFIDFAEKIVLATAHNNSIKIDSSVVYRPNDF